MTSRLVTTKDLAAMLWSLRAAACFTITRGEDTRSVRHTRTGEVVLEALSKGPRGPWIARIHPNLFDT